MPKLDDETPKSPQAQELSIDETLDSKVGTLSVENLAPTLEPIPIELLGIDMSPALHNMKDKKLSR